MKEGRCINLGLRAPKETVAYWEGYRDALKYSRGVAKREATKLLDDVRKRRKNLRFSYKPMTEFIGHIEEIYLPRAREAVELEEKKSEQG